MIDISLIGGQILDGIVQAMILILIASGLTIIFGLMDVLNFAHGSFYMFGAYVGMSTYIFTGSFVLSIMLAFIIIAAVGAAIEYMSVRPLYNRDPVYHLLLTFSLLLILNRLVHVIWGASPRSVSPPAYLDYSVSLLGMSYPMYRLFVLGFGIVFSIGLYLFLKRTDFGLIIRAGVHNKEAIRSLGINLPKLFTLTFALGVGLAAISGVIAAPIFGLTPSMGDQVIIDAFIVVIIGGLGSFRGVIVASLLIAQIRSLGVLALPRLTTILVLVALIIVLTIRPQGIFSDLSTMEDD